jgi:hypothetical protein
MLHRILHSSLEFKNVFIFFSLCAEDENKTRAYMCHSTCLTSEIVQLISITFGTVHVHLKFSDELYVDAN